MKRLGIALLLTIDRLFLPLMIVLLAYALAGALSFFVFITAAKAQSWAPTQPLPVTVTLGLTFQQLRPAENRRSVYVQNNNTTADNCFLLVGGPWLPGDTTTTSRAVNGVTLTAAQAAILLQPGRDWSRLSSFIPNDRLLVTCATTGDSVYADVQ
jgi:hypothetical protein